MNPYLTEIVCAECGHTAALSMQAADPFPLACPACGSGWLDARYDYEAVRAAWTETREGRHTLDSRPRSLWRYAELLPLPNPDPEISFGEGYSPLIRLYQYERLYNHPHIYVKDERHGPTSSFKDRQAALSVTDMRRVGITECVLASTGNAAVAYAAYCARAGIKLWLFLTSMVLPEKMREAALYGAEVVKVSGTYDETKRVAAEFAKRKGIYLDRGARSIPGKESMKTLAFEIAEQFGLQRDGSGWRSPDWYIQAVSGGIGPLGVWKGFAELFEMGLIDKMPKLGIIQSAGCAPMVNAFAAGQAQADPVVPKTLITVLATGDPGHSYAMLREAVLYNGGTMIAVEDGKAFAAMRKLASKAGFSVEPATAVAFAGLEKLLTDGTIQPDESVVVNCSGHTFPVEGHILGDQYTLELELKARDVAPRSGEEGLSAALRHLDEQVTSILVVDDNPNDRRLIRRLLKAHKSYRVFEARSGAEALKMVYDHQPDLIVSDLTMPEMDGFTLLERLKSDPNTAHIPVVVVSAKTLTSDDRHVLEQYSDSVWMKSSFDTRQLVDHIVRKLGDTPVEVIRPPRSRREANGERASDGQAHTVVIIDDNVHDVRLARRMIEAAGNFAVTEAYSGREGLKAIYAQHPDLIILDLMLPDMDGYSVLQSIQNDAQLREIPIIVYSACQLDGEERARLQSSIRAIIEKSPVDREAFISRVNEALM
jgi:threonine synthase